MAANYLQTLNWHSDPEIMKHIISFYTKAQVRHAGYSLTGTALPCLLATPRQRCAYWLVLCMQCCVCVAEARRSQAVN